MTPSISDLIELARGAGDILRQGYGKSHLISNKGRIDLVTEMDHQAEAFLLEKIYARFPGHSIVTEESGELSGTEPYCWYIDPLDGTTNYAHALPIFSVSVAFAAAGQLLLGVVYDPMRDECFSGVRGQGAWLNGEPIRVSETRELMSSLLVTGFPYDSYKGGQNNVENFSHFTRLTQGVRRLGSAAIDLCYVACGRLEGYWEISLRPYDLAAGVLIVEEAGGRVTDLYGDTNYLKPPYAILAGNPHIHALMLNEFSQIHSAQK